MMAWNQTLRKTPMSEGGGGSGPGLGGSGAPIPPGGVTPSQKLPNAMAAGIGGGGGAGGGVPAAAPTESKPKIQAFSQVMGSKKAGEDWKRKTNTTGTGATHMKSFHCKLNAESLDYLDQQINEWLDAHPDFEVKLVSTSVGEWTGKIKEPALVVSVWV